MRKESGGLSQFSIFEFIYRQTRGLQIRGEPAAPPIQICQQTPCPFHSNTHIQLNSPCSLRLSNNVRRPIPLAPHPFACSRLFHSTFFCIHSEAGQSALRNASRPAPAAALVQKVSIAFTQIPGTTMPSLCHGVSAFRSTLAHACFNFSQRNAHDLMIRKKTGQLIIKYGAGGRWVFGIKPSVFGTKHFCAVPSDHRGRPVSKRDRDNPLAGPP